MKTIRLQRIRCQYFKGLKSLDMEFDGKNSTIMGANATGKTSVFDAYLWCLFGKDSTGRTDFAVKTLDESGRPIPKVQHSVEVTLSVDGRSVSFERRYIEQWTKPRGEDQQILSGHKSEFLIDGIKIPTKAEYDSRISDIITEDLFRLLSDPTRFFAMDETSQRKLLLEMAGNVSVEDVIAKEPQFSKFSGRDMELLIRDTKSQILAIRNALKGIPMRIETASKLLPEKRDIRKLEEDRAELQARLDKAHECVAQHTSSVESAKTKFADIQAQILSAERSLAEHRAEIRKRNMQFAIDTESEIAELNLQIAKDVKRIEDANYNVNSYTTTILPQAEAALEALRGQYREIASSTFQMDEEAGICPTCHRALDAEDILDKQRLMEESFNQHKAELLRQNKESGIRASEKVKECREFLATARETIHALEMRVTANKADLAQKQAMLDDNKTQASEEDDAVSLQMQARINELKLTLATVSDKADDTTAGLVTECKSLESQISDIDRMLAEQEQYERIQKEIGELEESNRQQNITMTSLEGELAMAEELVRKRDLMLKKRLDSLFRLVTFQFSTAQLNGRETTSCQVTVRGVPYSDCNSAAKTNAGLDIINAISGYYNIYCPIFVDNRESYNSILQTYSQIIALQVTEDRSLRLVVNDDEHEDDGQKSFSFYAD